MMEKPSQNSSRSSGPKVQRETFAGTTHTPDYPYPPRTIALGHHMSYDLEAKGELVGDRWVPGEDGVLVKHVGTSAAGQVFARSRRDSPIPGCQRATRKNGLVRRFTPLAHSWPAAVWPTQLALLPVAWRDDKLGFRAVVTSSPIAV